MKLKSVIFCLSLSFVNSYSSFAASESQSKAYEQLNGCVKQEILWQKIKASKHDELPKLSKFGKVEVFKMLFQSMTTKVERTSDFAPKGWKKRIHKRGVMAKVKFQSTNDHEYTGLFQGAPCSLLRLSLTFRPDPNNKENNKFAPGLAWKIFRDGAPSANVSALYALSGQKLNYNFMENPLSNIVPSGDGLGEKIIHYIFSRVSKFPEELRMEDIASFLPTGQKVNKVKAPRQIFFVPNPELNFSKDAHDFREDFQKLPEGAVLYTVKVLDNKQDFSDYKLDQINDRANSATTIGEIVLDSKFIASEFGDTGIFFKHEAK